MKTFILKSEETEEEGAVLYRFEYQSVDSGQARIELSKHKILRKTPKGSWTREICQWIIDEKRWISDTGKKRYAYPTKKEALINLVARTERRREYLLADLNLANDVLRQAALLDPVNPDLDTIRKAHYGIF